MSADKKTEKILIVEDESIIAYDLMSSLQQMGYDVTAIVADGEEALREAGESPPDLILMDIILSGDMDGIEASREIHKRWDIPVIYLTANADQATVDRARDTGPYAYINKPISDRDLYASIDTALYKHRMEEKLRRNQEKYRMLVEEINDLVYEADENGVFTFVSPVVESIGGYTPEELLGRNVFDFIYAEDQPGLLNAYNRLKSGNLSASEYRVVTRSGEIRWVRSSSRPIIIGGVFRGTRGVMTDIMDRKRAEEALVRTRNQLLDIIHFLPDATFVVDTAGRVVMWNKAIERMTGSSREEMIGKDNYEYAVPFYGERRPLLIDIVRKEATAAESKYDFVKRNGMVIYAEVFTPRLFGGKGAYLWGTASLLTDEAGKTWGAIESIRDITAIKMTENALKESQEKFSRTFHHSPISMSVTSFDDGRYIEINDRSLQALGYSRDEVIGRTTMELNIWADPGQREKLVSMLRESGSVRQKAAEFRTKSGEIRKTLVSMEMVKIGASSFIFTYSIDVEEHMKIFKSLLR